MSASQARVPATRGRCRGPGLGHVVAVAVAQASVQGDPEDEHDYGDRPHRPDRRACRQQQDDQRSDS
jgi:hypothetical protein